MLFKERAFLTHPLDKDDASKISQKSVAELLNMYDDVCKNLKKFDD